MSKRDKYGREDLSKSSGTPSVSAVTEASKERKRKQVLEKRIGKEPEPPEVFFCDQCKLFYFEVDTLTGVNRKGECPVHYKLASRVCEEAPAPAGKVKKEAAASKKGKKK